jgi:hypothetical protein
LTNIIRIQGIGPSFAEKPVADGIKILESYLKYSDLLEEAGVDIVVELSKRLPETLYARLAEVNGIKKLAKRNSTLPEVKSWVEQEKQMPKMIQY